MELPSRCWKAWRNDVSRAIRETAENLLMYAPVATKEQFINAIAYLVRRLDENTSKENFLRYAGGLKTGLKEWDYLRNQFIDALLHKDKPRQKPHRVQDRISEVFSEPKGTLFFGRIQQRTQYRLVSEGKPGMGESYPRKMEKTAG